MSDVTLGKVTSEPNSSGEHNLKCPKCNSNFLSKITKDDQTGAINNVACPACHHTAEPKYFVAAAHQQEVNSMAMDYAVKEFKKAFKKLK